MGINDRTVVKWVMSLCFPVSSNAHNATRQIHNAFLYLGIDGRMLHDDHEWLPIHKQAR